MKKFFHKVESAFQKMFGSTTWEQTVSATLTYVGPLVELLVGLTAGAGAEDSVTRVITIVKADLGTLAAVVNEAHATPSDSELKAASNALNSIKDNLPQLLAAGAVKNSAHAAVISATVSTIIGEVDAIVENIPGLKASAAVAVKA